MASYDILIDNTRNETPKLVYARTTTPVVHNGYYIGSKSDPHWKPYPKSLWPQGQSQTQVGTILTDYEWDANHNAMYVSDPNNSPITYEYAKALEKRIFLPVRNYNEQAAKDSFARNVEIQRQMEEQRKLEIKNRIKQLTTVISEQTKTLQSLEREFEKMKADAGRSARSIARDRRVSESVAQNIYLQTLDPLIKKRAEELEPTINTLKQNLIGLTNELNEYKKLK